MVNTSFTTQPLQVAKNQNKKRQACRRVIREFISVRQAAEMLGYSAASGTVNRLIREGVIEAENGPAHGYMVYLDSVQKLVDSGFTVKRKRGRPPAHAPKPHIGRMRKT